MEFLQPLIALMLVRIQMEASEPGVVSVPSALLALLLYFATGWITTRAAALRQQAMGLRVRVPGALSLLHMVVFVGLIFATDWVAFAVSLTRGLPLVTLLLAYTPYLVFRMLCGIATYEFEPEALKARVSERHYLTVRMRLLLLVVIPGFLLDAVVESLTYSQGLGQFAQAYSEVFLTGVVLLAAPLVTALSPLLARWILGATPLPDGPLRDRIRAYFQRSGFAASDVLMFDTGLMVQNAVFIGVLPGLRYVLLTDALLATLSEPEIVAVVAHETGHGRKRHLLYFLMMALTLLLISTAMHADGAFVLDGILSRLDVDPQTADLLISATLSAALVLLWVIFIFGGLGWISRRFETEADLHAVTTLSEPADYTKALETVGHHAGGGARSGGLRHFGISQRILLIQQYLGDQDFKVAFDSRIRNWKRVLIALFAGGVLWFTSQVPAGIGIGRVRMAWLQAQRLETVDAHEQALSRISSMRSGRYSREAASYEAATLASLGDLALKVGDWEKAKHHLDRLELASSPRDVIGSFNAKNLRVLLATVEGRGDSQQIDAVASELEALVASYEVSNESIDLTFSDLYLAHRAAGGRGPLRGDAAAYSPVAKLLRQVEVNERARTSPQTIDAELWAAAKRDLNENVARKTMFEAAIVPLAGSGWLERRLAEHLPSAPK